MSEKLDLKRHISYLEARRTGAEYVVGKTPQETLEFIHSLTKSIQDNNAKLATIEQGEQEMKDAEKARKAELHKELGGKSW